MEGNQLYKHWRKKIEKQKGPSLSKIYIYDLIYVKSRLERGHRKYFYEIVSQIKLWYLNQVKNGANLKHIYSQNN